MSAIFRNLLKVTIPISLRQKIRIIQKAVVYYLRRQSIRVPVAFGKPVKIIIGAAMTHQAGWHSTNQQWLDIVREDHWQRVFRGKALLTHVLAEHVFEHLTANETREALRLVALHMRPDGHIRIAVPDGYHPDPVYLLHVGIAGVGADAEDHKQLLNCDLLMKYLSEAGFTPELQEGYRDNGELVQRSMTEENGLVIRSRSNSKAKASRVGWDFVDAQTSLVVDGRLRG